MEVGSRELTGPGSRGGADPRAAQAGNSGEGRGMIRAMDPQRFQAAYRRLQNLDERMTHKVRPRSHATLSHATHEQLEGRVRDLSEYTLELKEIVDDMFQAIAAAPPKPQPKPEAG